MLFFLSLSLQVLLTIVLTATTHQNGDVRLADRYYRISSYYNRQYVYGRVEIIYNSTWGTVCWDRWSYYESKPVCKEIGYHGPSDWRRTRLDRVIQDREILLDGVYCSSEERLRDCRHDGYYRVRDSCTHYDDVWVECYRNLPALISDLPIRLSNPESISGYDSLNNPYMNEHSVLHAGLLQANLYGSWHYISGRGWNDIDATVACGQLGYPNVNSLPEYNPDLINTESQITSVIMRNLDCHGNERELKECYHEGWTVSDYDIEDLAAVDCITTNQFLSGKQTEFRLKGSSNYWEGRLEVLHDFSWGSVCGKRFTLTHGDIACKSLGLGKAQKVFQTASSGYGRGVGRIWLGDFECRDPQSADSLLECKHSRWRYSSCRTDHGWDVGVRCSVPRPDTKIRVLRQFIPRSYTPPGVNLYFTELYHEGTWSSPCCYTLLLNLNTDRLCRELGLGFGVTQESRCEFDSYSRSVSGLIGYIYCIQGNYFSENCLRGFNPNSQCIYGYDVIACAEKLPDLVPNLLYFERTLKYYRPDSEAVLIDGRAKNRIDYKSVRDLTCALDDNCLASSADRNNPDQEIKLLRFASHTDNFGLLPLRPPGSERDWIWHNCHEHYHSMEIFVTYHLLDVNGIRVAEGHKASFCLEDSICVNPSDRYFYCDHTQGISVNCGDHYGAELDCQWIDITGVPPGNYTVELKINPLKTILESNYDNNVLTCMIDYGEDGYYSTYNCLHSDHILKRTADEQ